MLALNPLPHAGPRPPRPCPQLPLSDLLPGCHYNLRLALPGGPLGSTIKLYVTLCLQDCPRMELRCRQAGAGRGSVGFELAVWVYCSWEQSQLSKCCPQAS